MKALSSLILLFTVVSAVTGAPLDGKRQALSMPLRRPKLQHTSFLSGRPLAINNFEDLVYTIDVTVGGQLFNLTLDTRARDAVLFSTKYKFSNHTCTSGDSKRRFFDTGLSGSYKDTGKVADGWTHYGLYRYPYVGAECGQQVDWAEEMKGTLGRDTFDLQGLSADGVPFILANYTSYALNPRWASDGVFPLGLMFGDSLYTIFTQIGAKQEVTLYLASFLADGSTNAPVGQVVLGGGKDLDYCASEWLQMPSAVNDNWAVVVTGIAIGPFPVYDYSAVVEISVESPVLVVPTVYFRLFVSVFGAEYDFELDTYTVDCAKAKSLPEIRFTYGDPSRPPLNYTVPPEQFVVPMETNQKPKCALLIVESDSAWTLGSQFLPTRCVNLDFEKSLISFADAVNA